MLEAEDAVALVPRMRGAGEREEQPGSGAWPPTHETERGRLERGAPSRARQFGALVKNGRHAMTPVALAVQRHTSSQLSVGSGAADQELAHHRAQAAMGPYAALVLLAAPLVSGCTTLIAGRGATADGSVMATHSDDGESGGDSRVVKVPAMDWARGSKRPIYYATEDYPRFVGERGVDAYLPANNPGATPSVPIGFIEQVNHTFGYYEATYGILNEHQVGIGESTCSAVFGASAKGHGGGALFSVDSLSRLAMERAT